MPDVYVAQGHGRRPDGTFDPGAREGEHNEQRDSKPVADACTRVLREAGVEVFSESEEHDDPNYRGTTSRANDMGVDCVVSFHFDWNQAPPGAFAIATTDEGRELGWAIEARVAEAGFDIRDYPDDRDGLYLLDNSHAPAVIFEVGRIGHEDIDETHEQEQMGEAAARGILDWLGVDMPLTDDDLQNIRQIIWFNADMIDYKTGKKLHASTHLRHARNDAYQARVDAAVARKLIEEGALSSTPLSPSQIEAIADAVRDEFAEALGE